MSIETIEDAQYIVEAFNQIETLSNQIEAIKIDLGSKYPATVSYGIETLNEAKKIMLGYNLGFEKGKLEAKVESPPIIEPPQ